MKEIKRILCPVDLWENQNWEFLEYAALIAKAFQAEVVLLYVSSRFIHFHDTPPNIAQTMDTLSAEVVHQSKGKICNLAQYSIFKDLKVSTLLYYGEAREKIIEAAKNERIDLIVMATHGRKGVNRVIFGSVAEHTVRLSPVPVLTIRPESV